MPSPCPSTLGSTTARVPMSSGMPGPETGPIMFCSIGQPSIISWYVYPVSPALEMKICAIFGPTQNSCCDPESDSIFSIPFSRSTRSLFT